MLTPEQAKSLRKGSHLWEPTSAGHTIQWTVCSIGTKWIKFYKEGKSSGKPDFVWDRAQFEKFAYKRYYKNALEALGASREAEAYERIRALAAALLDATVAKDIPSKYLDGIADKSSELLEDLDRAHGRLSGFASGWGLQDDMEGLSEQQVRAMGIQLNKRRKENKSDGDI